MERLPQTACFTRAATRRRGPGNTQSPKIASMTLHQLSVSYDECQDRLLVRLLTTAREEYRVWLTRRLTFNLLPHLQQQALELAQSVQPETPAPTRRLMAEMQRERHIQSANFSQHFEAEATRPLGAAPLLATQVHFTPQPKGVLHLQFEEKPDAATAGRKFDAPMPLSMQHAFLHLIEGALARSGWGDTPLGLELPQKHAAPVAAQPHPAGARVLH